MSKDRRPLSLAEQLSKLKSEIQRQIPGRKRPAPGPIYETPAASDNPQGIDVSDFEQQMRDKEANATLENPHGPFRQGFVLHKGRAVEVAKKIGPPKRDIDPAQSLKQPVAAVRLGGNLTPFAMARLKLDDPVVEQPPETVAPETPSVPNPQKVSATALPTKPVINPVTTAFERIKDIVKNSAPRIETRPEKVTPKVAKQIRDNIELGSRLLAERPDRDESGYLVGFDFGTSSLKIVFHQPYAADDPVAALEVPKELRSQGHPYLWQTVVWFDAEDESFSLYPRARAVPLEGFKTGIIAGYDGQRVRDDLPVTRADAAAAFIALQKAHLTGWYSNNRPLGPVGGEHFLSFNFGIPTAAQDDHVSFRIFNRIINAARILAADCATLTLSKVRTAYQQATDGRPDGCEVIPELCAALAGYAKLPTSHRRSHVLVDVGASTLDIVAFNLNDDDQGTNIAAFAAGVELLGAAALETVRTAGIEDQIFRSACDHQFNTVFKRACEPSVAPSCFKPSHRRDAVQLVITGGGCATDVHSAFVESMPGSILGRRRIIKPAPPKHMTKKRCDGGRLLLAFGLAQDVPDILRIKLPSQIPPLPPKNDDFPGMITKDQM